MPLANEVLLAYLQRAAEEPLGLLIRTDQVHLLKNDFYRAIFDAGHTTESLGIMICTPSIPNHIYLVKRSVELEP